MNNSHKKKKRQIIMNKSASVPVLSLSKNSTTNVMMTRLEDLEMRCKELEQGWNKTKSILQQIRPGYSKPWRKIGSDEVDKEHEETKVFHISNDLYCVVATASWKSPPFWFALFVIFGFQFSLLLLLATSQIELPIEDTNNNPLQVPANVKTEVRVAQALILVIALFSQSDLLSGIEDLIHGRPTSYRGANRFRNMSSLQWTFATIIRICQGLTNILCAFILSVQSSTVFDVLLNVLGVGFVSDLDDLAFRLGALGYFGGRMKSLTRDIQECGFVRERRQVHGQRHFVVWLKESFHTIMAFILLIILMYFVVHISLQQDRGEFYAQHIFVEMNDEATPVVYALSGCYAAGEFFNNRLVYKQVGAVVPENGLFMYCSDWWGSGSGAWILTIASTYEYFGCSDLDIDGSIISYDVHVMVSEATDAFDLLEAATGKWYTSKVAYKPVDSIVMKEFDFCKDHLRVVTDFDLSKARGCAVLQGASSLQLYQVQTAEINPKEYTNVALTHPVYMSMESTPTNGKEIVFFTGRSWVMTTERQLGYSRGFKNGPEVLDFLSVSLFDNYGDHPDPTSDWVNLITQPLDPDIVQSGPHHIIWYHPRHTNGPLPLVDLSRPAGTLECFGCDSDPANPISFCGTGYCNEATLRCECLYNETGRFCEIGSPLGNGVCDEYSEDGPVFANDGGDCCAATCSESHCGKGGLETLFGLRLSEEELTVALTNASTSELIGFQRCQDYDMTAVLLEIVPVSNATQVCVPPFTVQCRAGSYWSPVPRIYLRTPLLCTNAVKRLVPERIMTPPGAGCNLTVDNATTAFIGIDHWHVYLEGEDSDTSDSILLEASFTFDQALEWSVPCRSLSPWC